VCKEKTNKGKRMLAGKKVVDTEIREIIRHADNLKLRGKIEEIKEELELS